MVSKAFFMSRHTAEFTLPLSTVSVHVYEQSLRAKAVERIDLKPHCSLLSNLFSQSNCIIAHKSIFQIPLQLQVIQK